jgi:hypothetical protein
MMPSENRARIDGVVECLSNTRVSKRTASRIDRDVQHSQRRRRLEHGFLVVGFFPVSRFAFGNVEHVDVPGFELGYRRARLGNYRAFSESAWGAPPQ